MENLAMIRNRPDPRFWEGRRILVTGHTGFKGGWLVLLLARLGAETHGYSINIPTTPSMFQVTGVADLLASDHRGDVADAASFLQVVRQIEPEVILHLAAQPLVITGYKDPWNTFSTNVLGTVSVLEAVRQTPAVKAVVVVTTDKVYRNLGLDRAFTERDDLGGSDPYSASKAAAELVAEAYGPVLALDGPQVVTVRAGNVIGGGDWSPWRLVPDILAAIERGLPLEVRYPTATRPWQHVLDPLNGYLLLVEACLGSGGRDLPRSWNFGPDASSIRSVAEVINAIAQEIGTGVPSRLAEVQRNEHELLSLDSRQAHALLHWLPRWDFTRSIHETVVWHQAFTGGQDMQRLTNLQIGSFLQSDLPA